MAVSDIGELIDLIEDQLQPALDLEEKRLVEEALLLKLVYEGMTGTAFSDKTPTEVAEAFTVRFITEMAVTVAPAVEPE